MKMFCIGKNIFSHRKKIDYCSCHATWQPSKTFPLVMTFMALVAPRGAAWGDASGKNWKYHFTQKDLCAVSNGVISCQLKRWSAVISLPLRHLARVVIRSVSNLCLNKNIPSRGLMWLKTGLQWRQIWKVSRSSLVPSMVMYPYLRQTNTSVS